MVKNWHIFTGTGIPHDDIDYRLPPPPHWRQFEGEILEERQSEPDPQLARRSGRRLGIRFAFLANEKVKDLVNTALYLRRPLLVTGKPGTGKSTLAYAVAYELKLGPVLTWPITSRSTIQEAIYRYDAIGRLQEASLRREQGAAVSLDISKYIRLGPVGTALLPSKRPRVLLIDEIDKSDIDLPNDLLNIFEEGEYEIPELARLSDQQAEAKVLPFDGQDMVTIRRGRVLCHAFPFVVITSNGERELPAPLLRRCLRLNIDIPTAEELAEIVNAHFGPVNSDEDRQRNNLIQTFLKLQDQGDGHLATDQLLNAIYLTGNNDIAFEDLIDDVFKKL